MIVKEQPSAMQLFFAMQSSIVPKIIWKILGVFLISIIVLIVDIFVFRMPHFSIAAMGIFGVALSLFLGFRNNSAYERWWEARKLWGSMIADVRSLGCDTQIFLSADADRRSFMYSACAFAHFHRGQLRLIEARIEAAKWVTLDDVQTIAAQHNPADAVLNQMAGQVAELAQADNISGFGQLRLTQSLASLALAQAGCERIASTPLPFVYSLLVRRTTYLYCLLLPFALIDDTSMFAPLFAAIVAYVFFGLQAITNELEMPFHRTENGLPLDAMCRTIEISVTEALGDPNPEPHRPQGFVLT